MNDATLAVVSQSGESLSFFDVLSGTRTGHLTGLISEPHELCFDARTNLLYVSHAYEHGWYRQHGSDCHEVSVVDCNQKQVVEVIDISPAKGPHYLVLDQKREILYVSVEGGLSDTNESGGIIGICLKTRKVIKSIGSGWATHWFVMTPDGTKAYTCNKEADFVSVIDLLEEKMVAKISLPGGCEQPAISKSGKLAYFPTPTVPFGDSKQPNEPSIQIIDTVSDKVVKSIALDALALTIHVDSQDRLLVGQYRISKSTSSDSQTFGKVAPLNGTLAVFTSKDEGYQQIASLEVGKVPLTILSSPDGKRAFVSNISSGTVTVVNLISMTVERNLEIDTVPRRDKKLHQGAHGLALIP
ncbi:surface layer protein [Viridothelium virens]|uniref:Surface layer protein n=1 Tax=Viridothelium virens TaxID=1048519 RepID=A0A6A6H915_VIRVR|nr:surface layer protein [Viridothelium virens]